MWDDSRAKLARMTADGEALVATARNIGRGLYEDSLEGLSAAEREEIAEGLKRIRDNLSRMNAEQKEAV